MECKSPFPITLSSYSFAELIETLWNVNSDKWTEQELQKLGINRNIVECKLNINGCKINRENAELIETL